MDQLTKICPNLTAVHQNYPNRLADDCFFCWKFNKNVRRDEIKLKNRKYCWLYPKEERRELKAIIPNFDHCKTLYTKCDYRLEQCAHEAIIKLEDQFKAHCKLSEKEMKMQNVLLDEMWENSQRYLILIGGGVCIKLYPEIISEDTEKRALRNFHINLNKVQESNYRLSTSLQEIRTTMTELDHRCAQLDNTVESPFILGSYYLRSLKYIRVVLVDLFNYFHQNLCKLKCWAEILDPGDSVSIEDYKGVITQNKNYEDNLMEYLNNCSCMRSKRNQCIQKHMSCYR